MRILECARCALLLSAAYFTSTALGIRPVIADPLGDKWAPWFEIGGSGATDDKSHGQAGSYGETRLWAPLFQSSSSVFFTDLRGEFFQGDTQEGNFALGYRKMMSGGWNVGAWAGYDYRHTDYGSNFSQVSFGVEALHPFWDFRANGYVPLNDDHVASSWTTVSSTGSTLDPTVVLTGDQIRLQSGGFVTTTTTDSKLHELALWGFDGEIGAKVPINLDSKFELRTYAGGFYFNNDELEKALAGPKGRVEFRINDILPNWSGSRLTFEAEAQWDDVRQDIYEGGVRLRLPFGGGAKYASLTEQEQRMTEGLERDTDIVTQTKVTSKSTSATTGSAFVNEKVEDAVTNVRFDQVLQTGGSKTTTDVAGSNSNTLIIVDGGKGTAGGVVLKNDQTLQGGGSTIKVIGVDSGKTANFTANGTTPTLASPTTGAVITTADNSHIVGVNVDVASGKNGIQVGSDNVYIEKTSFSGSGISSLSTAIAVTGAIGDLHIKNVSAKDLSFFLGGTASGSDATVKNVTLDDVAYGIFGGGYDSLSVKNVTQNGGVSIGFISATKNLTIDGYTAASLIAGGDTGLSLRGGVENATITDVTIGSASLSNATGVTLVADTGNIGNVTFNNLHVFNMMKSGVGETTTGYDVGNLTLNNAHFENIAGDGLFLLNQATGSTVAVSNSVFDHVATTSSFAVFHNFQNAQLAGSGNTLIGPGTACSLSPTATGSIEYSGGSCHN